MPDYNPVPLNPADSRRVRYHDGGELKPMRREVEMDRDSGRRAYYQISTDVGYVSIEMPYSMSHEDTEDVVATMELIIRQMRRRTYENGQQNGGGI